VTATEETETPAPKASPLAPGADRLRESARWLVISFGAVAAVVFAGITVAGFGSVDIDTAPTQFWTALAAIAVALAGVAAALVDTMSLAAASSVTIEELCAQPADGVMRKVHQALAKEPILAPWEMSVRKFVKEVRRAEREYDVNQKYWATSTELEPVKVYTNRAAERLTQLSAVQTVVMETASYLRLRHRFGAARWRIVGSLVLAAAGAVTFVLATGTAATESVPRRALAATWTVPADDRDTVHDQLGGTACTYDLDEVPAVILDEQGDGKEADIVTTASDDCQPVRLVVGTGQLKRT
jgi:hypothetical protein